jgi:hypothetical protein
MGRMVSSVSCREFRGTTVDGRILVGYFQFLSTWYIFHRRIHEREVHVRVLVVVCRSTGITYSS